MKSVIALAAMLASTVTSAQDAPSIEIKGARFDQRREDTSSTLTLGREELALHGDRTLADALRRLPGVTVGDGGIQMRGLGNGYTQILLNGTPAPSGFALDTLPPDAVERVEVLRSASAILGTQGMAGTINIVLRKSVRRDERDEHEIQLGWDSLHGDVAPRITLQSSGKADGWSHNIGAVYTGSRQATGSTIIDSAPDLRRTTRTREENDGKVLNLSPRVNWTLPGGDTLSLQSLVNLNRRAIQLDSHEQVQLGDSGDFQDVNSLFRLRGLLLRSELIWQRTLESNAKLELKLGGSHHPRATDYDFAGIPAGQLLPTRRTVHGDIRENAVSYSGKVSMPLGASGHALITGWDGGGTQRMQTRIEHEYGPSSALNFIKDDRYDGRIDRLALFAEDEWRYGANTVSAGLRWESLTTAARDRHSAPVRQRSRVLSPVLNWLHKLEEGSQLRLGVSRTYKAPNMLDLVPRRFTSDNNNSPTNPDEQGNPALRPELAWGVDAGIDHYFGKSGLLSASLYARDIDNVTLTTLYQENGRWIAMPANQGKARAYGGALELRAPVTQRLSMRSNLALNRSRIAQVPGPDNRLDRQAPLSAGISADYRLSTLTLSAEFNLEAGRRSRTSASYASTLPWQRKLDLRAAWRLAPGRMLRVAVSDVLHQDSISSERYDSTTSWRASQTISSTGPTLRFSFEQKWSQ